MPRILVSNDDGIYAEGLKPLLAALRPLGEVVAIVPDNERSAASHSITLHKPFRVQEVPVEINSKKIIHVYITNGTPADCVKFGIHEFFKNKKVDLVIGGINNGANLGEDAIYSGTVAVARESAMLGIPSFSISVIRAKREDYLRAAAVAQRVAKSVLKKKLPSRVFLNINVPPMNGKKMEILATRLGRRIYGNEIPSGVDPRGNPYYWLAGVMPKGIPEGGTDIAIVKAKKVSVTPLTIDSTCSSFLPELSRWKF